MHRISLKESWHILRCDLDALAAYHAGGTAPSRAALLFSPSFWCVALYRTSRYFHVRRFRLMARLFWHINFHLTGADINPIADIGPGFAVVNPVAITIAGKAGSRLLVTGMGGFGGGLKMEDVGAGPGFANLGDNVVLHMGAVILGPQRIGNNVIIGPNCTVMEDVEDDTEIWPNAARVRYLPRHIAPHVP